MQGCREAALTGGKQEVELIRVTQSYAKMAGMEAECRASQRNACSEENLQRWPTINHNLEPFLYPERSAKWMSLPDLARLTSS